MTNQEVFIRLIRRRSFEHKQAMTLLTGAGLFGQTIAILRQELDSLVHVIYLLSQSLERREFLIGALIRGEKWSQDGKHRKISDSEMVDFAQELHGWTKSVYKFGCAFIHLSILHDYNDGDPLAMLKIDERDAILNHCRYYHGGPRTDAEHFSDLIPYLPKVLQKISTNLDCYLDSLEEGDVKASAEV
ncbi:hypothetical protein [Cypionkella sp.]|uniref:hypothetical protein n=1 Tax=Cypionkella sp. TaxID=2811411 RepID=UPI003752DE06